MIVTNDKLVRELSENKEISVNHDNFDVNVEHKSGGIVLKFFFDK